MVEDRNGTVVVGFDGSGHPEAMLDEAARAAGPERRTVVVVTVVPRSLGTGEQARRTARRRLEGAVSGYLEAHPRGDVRFTTSCLTEDELQQAPPSLREAVLLVVGARGRFGRLPLVIGSTGRSLFKATDCPVLFVPEHGIGASAAGTNPDGTTNPDGVGGLRVVAGLSEHPDDLQVIRVATAEARRRGARLDVVHAVRPTDAREPFQLAWQAAREAIAEGSPGPAPGADVTLTMAEESPAQALLGSAHDAALLVIGGRAGAVSGLIRDSVSRAVIEHATCPVLTLPRSASPTSARVRPATAAG